MGQVGAGAERRRLAGDHDGADGRVAPRAASKAAMISVDHRQGEGVAALGVAQGDGGDAGVDVGADEGHGAESRIDVTRQRAIVTVPCQPTGDRAGGSQCGTCGACGRSGSRGP